MSVGFLYCLKRERDISVKPILGGVKTAFRWIPALRGTVSVYFLTLQLFFFLEMVRTTKKSEEFTCIIVTHEATTSVWI